MSIARFRHVAMPLLGAGNQPSSAWCKRPSCLSSKNRCLGTHLIRHLAHERTSSGARWERTTEARKIRWELTGGLASMGARTLANDCSLENLALWNQPCREHLMRRTRLPWGEAEACWEETSKCTRKASRGRGPSTHVKIAEITSGRATIQQGLAATCEDSQDEGQPKTGRGEWSDA